MAIQMPASNSQIILPTVPKGPVPMSGWPVSTSRDTGIFPKGKKANSPITKQARPQGMPTMEIKQSTPKNHQVRPIQMPPSKNQITLPRQLMTVFS